MNPPKHILPIIVLAQFCCTSLWFAGNGVMADLAETFALPNSALSNLTAFVQFGFICGTLTFALLMIADRFSPSRVFFVSALLGAGFNLLVIWEGNSLWSLLGLRFMTGFFLAGIYPVGMKIAADYFEKGLGRSLGFLVGALVLGTAFPHLIKAFTVGLPWKLVLMITSGLATLGGIAMLALVPDGPFRKPSQRLELAAFFKVFKVPAFRSAAFGYFGHMWELYAFWAFVPVLLAYYGQVQGIEVQVSFWSFLIIGIGSLACVIGGLVHHRFGTKRTASFALTLSGICCLLSPVIFQISVFPVLIGFLLLWGMAVIADSPLFSTLVAQNADPELKGTALTIVNCIGFAITIGSIQLLGWMTTVTTPLFLFVVLAIGPILGLIALWSAKY